MVGLVATSKRAYAKGNLPRLLLPVPPPCDEPLPIHGSTGDPPSRLATQPFQAWVWSIPSFILCCLARVEAAIYTFYVLLGCPFPGPLARESWLLLGLFLSVHTGISGFSSSSAPS